MNASFSHKNVSENRVNACVIDMDWITNKQIMEKFWWDLGKIL